MESEIYIINWFERFLGISHKCAYCKEILKRGDSVYNLINNCKLIDISITHEPYSHVKCYKKIKKHWTKEKEKKEQEKLDIKIKDAQILAKEIIRLLNLEPQEGK